MAAPATRSSRVSRPVWVLLMLIWCVVIFTLSAQPHLRISHDTTLDIILRKAAHIASYAVLAALASMTFRQEGSPFLQRCILTVGFCLAYAISDEWHQTFVAGRHGSPVDVAIDMIGVAITVTIITIRHRRSTEP